jgi:hypothetical protein
MSSRRILSIASVLLVLLSGLGCYETEYPLGSPDKSTVDRAYVGDFTMTDADKVYSIAIRNLDGHQYYVEMAQTNQNDKGPDRRVGYTADVNGVTFANLRQLTDDGSVSNKFLVMRVSISSDGSKLTLRNLNDKFFSDKSIDSQAALTKLIQDNLDNNDMYDGDAVVATRVPVTPKT